MTSQGVIPFYFEVAAWALRRELAHMTRDAAYTLAQTVTRAFGRRASK